MMLRDYQVKAVSECRSRLERGESVCLVSPCGSGKTTMGVAISEGWSLLWIAHRVELIDQAADRLRSEGRKPDIVCASIGKSSLGDGRTYVASVQTLLRRPIPATDLVVIDEGHRAIGRSYQRAITGAKRLLLATATPFRLDGRGLGNVVDSLVVAAYPSDLIRDGYLVMPRMFAPDVPDLAGVTVARGDFDLSELGDRMKKPRLVGSIVEHWRKLAPDTRTLVYAVNIEHAETITAAFGPIARIVTADTPKAERAEMFASLASGRLLVLVNVGIATEGTDIPSLETIVVARPTASLALHLQIVGRVMRPHGDKTATLIDHAGNLIRHGPPDQRIEYSLDGRTVRSEAVGTGLKRCKECLALVPVSAESCTVCGSPFVSATKPLRVRDSELGEYMPMGDRAAYWADLVIQRKRDGHSPTWAVANYFASTGRFPDPWSSPFSDTPKPTDRLKQEMWNALATLCDDRGYDIGWASHRYKSVFGVWPKGVKSDDQKRPRPMGVA